MKKLNIIGAGGFGREVQAMLPYCDRMLANLYDDDVLKTDVQAALAEIPPAEDPFVIAVGDSLLRRVIYQKLSSQIDFDILLHKRALVQDESSIQIGVGSIITAGSILTCNISLGRFTLINLNCTVGHDVRMGDFCSLMPSVNLGGEVTLEDAVYIGTGANILPGISIGKNSIVGAGAVVTKDVPPNTTVKGVPAKR